MDYQPPINSPRNILDLVQALKSRGDEFAVATVVKTVSVTAAKPGAKAVIDKQGAIVEGWIGGGCARHAVLKAAVEAITDGQSRLVSIRPEELIEGADFNSATDSQYIQARNMCPSQGSMEIFIEPVLANPALLILGGNPVAQALARLGVQFDLDVQLLSNEPETENGQLPYHTIKNPENINKEHSHRYIVVATQGSGDMKALELSLHLQSRHIAFVGSVRKITYLRSKLSDNGFYNEQLQRIQCPAGMDIHAVTPQEIALSILADIVRRRRASS